MGRGGGLVVSIPAFYSDDPSLNPAGYLINFLYEKTKINEKEAGVGPSSKKVSVVAMVIVTTCRVFNPCSTGYSYKKQAA